MYGLIFKYGFRGKHKVDLIEFNDNMLSHRKNMVEIVGKLPVESLQIDNPNQRMSTHHKTQDAISLVSLIPSLEEPDFDKYGGKGYSTEAAYTFSKDYVVDYSDFKPTPTYVSDYDSKYED